MKSWGYILFSYASLLALGLSDNIRGPLFPEVLTHYQVSDFIGSFVFATSSFMGLMASFLNSYWGKYLHQYRILQIAVLLMALGVVGIGLSNSYLQLMFCVSIFGLSMGMQGIAQNYLVAVGTDSQSRSRWLSGLHAMYGLASLISPILVSELARRGWTWQQIFILIGCLSLPVVAGSFFNQGPRIDVLIPKETETSKPLDRRRLLTLTSAFSLYVVAELLISSRLSLHLRRNHGFDISSASQALSVFFVFMLLGRGFSTWFVWKQPLRQILLGCLASSFVLLSLGILVHPYFIILSGLTMAPFYPLAISFISDIFSNHVQKAITTMMILQSLSVVLMHVAVGRFTDLYGLTSALWVGPLACAVSFVLILKGSKTNAATAT